MLDRAVRRAFHTRYVRHLERERRRECVPLRHRKIRHLGERQRIALVQPRECLTYAIRALAARDEVRLEQRRRLFLRQAEQVRTLSSHALPLFRAPLSLPSAPERRSAAGSRRPAATP